MKIYKFEAGQEVTEITMDEALKLQQAEEYGTEFVTAVADTREEALELADLYDAGKIGIDNISGQLAIQYGLVGLQK